MKKKSNKQQLEKNPAKTEKRKNRSQLTGKWGGGRIKREGDTEREWERGRNCS